MLLPLTGFLLDFTGISTATPMRNAQPAEVPVPIRATGQTTDSVDGPTGTILPNFELTAASHTADFTDSIRETAGDDDDRSSDTLFGVPLRSSTTDKANAVRTELLIRKFLAKDKELPPEQEARLKMASERVRLLLARVVPEDFDYLSETLERSDLRSQRGRQIDTELGI